MCVKLFWKIVWLSETHDSEFKLKNIIIFNGTPFSLIQYFRKKEMVSLIRILSRSIWTMSETMRILLRTSFAYGRILFSPPSFDIYYDRAWVRSHPYRGPSSPQRARQESRAASAPAVVPRVDYNSISPTKEREHCCAAFCTLPAYQSSVINLETNCRSPRRPIAERCNGPAMKGVDGTVRCRWGAGGNSAANEPQSKQQ